MNFIDNYLDYEADNLRLSEHDPAVDGERKFSWCADESGECFCNGAVRYGATGPGELYEQGYFRENPEVGRQCKLDPRLTPAF